MSGLRKALIIANDQYEQEALSDLLAPAADAEALGRVLGDPKVGGFAVQVMRNEPSYVITAQIEELFSENRRDDVLLLHFSGHGLKGESGELFFAAANTKPTRLRATAVSAEFVQQCMRDSLSRSIVLLLDCCYGGAFAQGVMVRAAGDVNVLDSFPQGSGRGRAVITASSAMEYAFEGDQLADGQRQRPSVFTAALVEGLAGEADRDEDGWVSLNELYEYVFDKVRERNPFQTPTRQVDMQGEMYLARSRRRRIHPAPLPLDLQTALTDPNMYARLGAVSELRSRLASDNLPAAAGAYEALAELTQTASQYVADLAAAALREAAVQPSHAEVSFGRIEQGSASPHQAVRLLGPPIARACTAGSSHDWIVAEQTAEGLDISIDSARAGNLSGSLDLKGPTGQATILITADLIPRPSRHARPPAQPLPPKPAPDLPIQVSGPVLQAPGRVTRPYVRQRRTNPGPGAVPVADTPPTQLIARSAPDMTQERELLPALDAVNRPLSAPTTVSPEHVASKDADVLSSMPSTPSARYASWARRVSAFLIDALPLVLAEGVVGTRVPVLMWLGWLVGLGLAGYNRWIRAGKTGQSWGKKALRVKLVSGSTGQPIGVGVAFTRDIWHTLDTFTCYIGWLLPLWGAKRQTLADKILNTVVIRI